MPVSCARLGLCVYVCLCLRARTRFMLHPPHCEERWSPSWYMASLALEVVRLDVSLDTTRSNTSACLQATAELSSYKMVSSGRSSTLCGVRTRRRRCCMAVLPIARVYQKARRALRFMASCTRRRDASSWKSIRDLRECAPHPLCRAPRIQLTGVRAHLRILEQRLERPSDIRIKGLQREETLHLQVFLPAHDLEVPDSAEHERLAVLRLVLSLGRC